MSAVQLSLFGPIEPSPPAAPPRFADVGLVHGNQVPPGAERRPRELVRGGLDRSALAPAAALVLELDRGAST